MRGNNRPQKEDYQAKIKPPMKKEFKIMIKLIKQAHKYQTIGSQDNCNRLLDIVSSNINDYIETHEPKRPNHH